MSLCNTLISGALIILIGQTPLLAKTQPGSHATTPNVLPEIMGRYITEKTEFNPAGKSMNHSARTRHEWWLWRQADEVRIRNTHSHIGEIWGRLKNNNLNYQWIDHRHQFVINYPPSDLKSVENYSNFNTKATIISRKLLDQLKKEPGEKVYGYDTEFYSGTVGEYKLAVIWIPQLSIPALIQQKTASESVLVKLQEVTPFSQATLQPVSIDSYDDMDFSDIGDNEANPVARLHMHGLSLAPIRYPQEH